MAASLPTLAAVARFPSRNWRNTHVYCTDPTLSGRNIRAMVGEHSKNITVQPDGTIVIGPKAYLDDIAAFLGKVARSTYDDLSNLTSVTDEQKLLSGKFLAFAETMEAAVQVMDFAAVMAHGYSFSLDERAFDKRAPEVANEAAIKAVAAAAEYQITLLQQLSEALRIKEAKATEADKAKKAE